MDILEKRDLYDINRKLTGETIFKGEEIPKDRYIIVVLVFIQNSKGEFLIQKRSIRKNGKYASTGGHAKSGETSLQGIQSEIQEEIGLSVNENELELIYEGREDNTQVFFDIYYLKEDIDINDLVLQEEEVESVQWFNSNEIKLLINDGLFMDSHAEEFFRMIDIFKDRGIDIENI